MTLKYDHLLGRTFIHGSTDCYGLIRDFYADNYGIELSNYARPDNWWNAGLNLYMDNFRNEGFILFEGHPRDYRAGDLFLYALGATVATHGAVYIGDGYIIHHLIGRMSKRDRAIGPWSPNHACAVLRHKELLNVNEKMTQVDLMELLPEAMKRKIQDEAA